MVRGHEGVVKELLAHGAMNGHEGVVKELLAHGAKTETALKNGETPLWVASQNGHAGVVKELLAHGAKTEKTRKDGSTPLWVASHYGHAGVVKELLARGAKKTARKDGSTALSIARRLGHKEVVRLLQKAEEQTTGDGQGVRCQDLDFSCPVMGPIFTSAALLANGRASEGPQRGSGHLARPRRTRHGNDLCEPGFVFMP
eukprot:TRINITY_DN487_c0_g1_i7.p1 TRINITY_DN487_c0_g1~~TRINITY_DN487_c0_g1_i7.p1  ORF type:complete len:200 (+),score=19.08 TRINITY_DN487_c0_g1_i7:269-868(+)